MSKKLLLVVIGVCVISLAACKGGGDSQDAPGSSSKAAPPKAPDSVSYSIEISHDGGETMQFEYYKDGDKESFMVKEKEGGAFKTGAWMLKDGAVSYIINPEERMALKFEGQGSPMAGQSFPFMHWMVEPDWDRWSSEAEKNSNMSIKKKGEEKVRGKKCKVMEITDKVNGQKILYYISDDNVVRRWVHSQGGAFQQKTTMDLLKYEVDKKVPADKLSVPKGYQVQDMSQMMKMPPNMPKR